MEYQCMFAFGWRSWATLSDRYIAGATPRQIAEQVKEHAFAASLQSNVVSPFQLAAEKHRIRYQGGKPDDITVVVAVVVPPP